MSYYDILGIPHNASQEDIKRAYREQIKFFHPDVFDGPPEVARIKSTQLNEAYEVLKDPKKRQVYDFKLLEEQSRKEQEERQNKREENQEQRSREEKKESEARTEKQEIDHKNGIDTGYLISLVFLILCLFLGYYTIQLYDEAKEKESEIEICNEEIEELNQELSFWKEYAVIVTREGEKYHTYGCQYIKGKDFWIYNKENAVLQGYEPCSICNPPVVE